MVDDILDFAFCQGVANGRTKRGLIGPSRLEIELGAPLGDNMMTGTVGVLEAIRSRKRLPPFPLL